MAEMHTTTVQWSGEKVLAEAMAAVAADQGHAPSVKQENQVATLTVEVVEGDLQTLRDRVDALLVAFSTLEEEHSE